MLAHLSISTSTLFISFNQLTHFNSLPASPAGSQNQHCHVGMFGSIMQIPSAEDLPLTELKVRNA